MGFLKIIKINLHYLFTFDIILLKVNMLNSFDERLEELEGSVIPIHRSTQKITLLYDSNVYFFFF